MDNNIIKQFVSKLYSINEPASGCIGFLFKSIFVFKEFSWELCTVLKFESK